MPAIILAITSPVTGGNYIARVPVGWIGDDSHVTTPVGCAPEGEGMNFILIPLETGSDFYLCPLSD